MDKEIIIDGIDVSGCCYAILPKDSCPAKAQPYAKETSCIACKEHNTKLNFCKNNHNCYYKQLQRKEQECEELKQKLITCLAIQPADVEKQLFLKNRECDRYKQALEKIEESVISFHYITIPFHRGITHALADIIDEQLDKIKTIINEVNNAR